MKLQKTDTTRRLNTETQMKKTRATTDLGDAGPIEEQKRKRLSAQNR